MFNLFNKKQNKLVFDFIENENVIFDDGYEKYDVIILGIWNDVATIQYKDGFKLNVHMNQLKHK